LQPAILFDFRYWFLLDKASAASFWQSVAQTFAVYDRCLFNRKRG
jgi:hypothetical protein